MEQGYDYVGLDSLNNNLSAGTYSVFVTDSLGCVSNTLEIELTQPDEMELVEGLNPDVYLSNYDGYAVSCAIKWSHDWKICKKKINKQLISHYTEEKM